VAGRAVREALSVCSDRQEALASYLTATTAQHRKALAELFRAAPRTKTQGLNQFGNFRPGAGNRLKNWQISLRFSASNGAAMNPATAMALWPNYRDLPFRSRHRLAITRDIGTVWRQPTQNALPLYGR